MKRVACCLGMLLLAVSFSPASFAKDDTRPFYLGFMGSYYHPDDDRGTDDGFGGKALFGWRFSDHVWFEGALSGFETDDAVYDRFNDYGWTIGADAMFPFMTGSAVTPFALVGGGLAVEDKFGGPDRDRPYVNGGLGALFALSPHLALRAEARYVNNFNDIAGVDDQNTGDVVASLGVQFDLPGKSEPKMVVVTQPTPAKGDTDGDGVADDADKCPSSPKGAQVDATGCPIDSDKDGVYDYLDKCPNTPRGLKVDANGCVVVQTLLLENVNFEFNKSTLTPAAKKSLTENADNFRKQPNLKVEIAGHTDSVGSDAYNNNLSMRRANAVRDFLITQGMNPKNMVAKGYGESQPVADNKTDAGRAQNRRVEFRVLNKEELQSGK
jgi:OOP family OmpA-OmpF porin